MILFLSKFPKTEEDYRDGLFQRVVHVDYLLNDFEKIYLTASPYRYFKKAYKINKDENRIIIECNLLLHISLILKLFSKANTVYVHSIHNLLYLFFFFKIFKKKYILDLHGLVPEEFAMQKDFKRVYIFSYIEKYIYNNLTFTIGVTEKMINFYKKKYPNSSVEYITYPILPNNFTNITEAEINIAKKSAKICFIYSGNLQVWQNIDLMLDNIKKLAQNKNYFFQILTGEVDLMKTKFLEKNIAMDNIDIRGVQTHELAEYYKKAHYGFILRDDIAVNNVACPTKLVEYLNYGIVPIVLSEEIGDFKEMGYESVFVDSTANSFHKTKSLKNIQIIEKLYEKSEHTKILFKQIVQ